MGNLDNVWWSLANEYDLLLSEISLDEWYEIEDFVASHNPRGHLISNHNCFKTWDIGRKNITHGSYQIKNMCYLADRIKKYGKPICVDECCYEGNLPEAWGNLSAEEMTARFWMTIASGAYCTHGETFLDENDVVWWAKGGELKGKSPARIKFLREIVEGLSGPFIADNEPQFDFTDNLPDEVKEIFTSSPAGRSFQKALAMADPMEMTVLQTFEHEYKACTEDKSVILNYLYQRCEGVHRFTLPKEANYKVEVIDTWNMTRTTVNENATGVLNIDLPGKPYMAILATKV